MNIKVWHVWLGRDEPRQIEFEVEAQDSNDVRMLLAQFVLPEFLAHNEITEVEESV